MFLVSHSGLLKSMIYYSVLFTYLLIYLQTLHDAFSRCVSVLSASSKPDDLSVQVIFYSSLIQTAKQSYSLNLIFECEMLGKLIKQIAIELIDKNSIDSRNDGVSCEYFFKIYYSDCLCLLWYILM